jgi:O-antigen/teichoic acid export membrane protein
MFGINLLALIVVQADKLILSRLLSLEAYGYYMLAATATGMLYSLGVPVTQAIFPRMVEEAARGDRDALARLFHNAAQLLTAIVAPAALALAVFAEPLLFAWSGDATLAATSAPLLRLLAIGTLVNLLMQLPYHLQLAYGWTGLALRANSVAVLALVPALLWLVPRYGAPAAAWAWLAVNLFYLLVVAPLTFRRLLPGGLTTWLVRDTAAPVAAAGLVIGAAALAGLGQASGRIAAGAGVAAAGVLALGAALAIVPTVRDRLKAALR